MPVAQQVMSSIQKVGLALKCSARQELTSKLSVEAGSRLAAMSSPMNGSGLKTLLEGLGHRDRVAAGCRAICLFRQAWRLKWQCMGRFTLEHTPLGQTSCRAVDVCVETLLGPAAAS